MKQVQVRMQVSSKTSAEVAYLSQNLGISKREAYALIVKLFLFERDLDKALVNLGNYLYMVKEPAEPKDDIPF